MPDKKKRKAAPAPAGASRRRASAPRPRVRLEAEDRRSQILNAAMAVCSEQGFSGMRTRDLAGRAGVSEALLFRHFPSKEVLIRAILKQVGIEEKVRLMEEKFERTSPREGLVSIAEHALTGLRDDPCRFRLVFFGVMETPELAQEFYRTFLSRLLALETRLFERAFAVRGSRARRSRRIHHDAGIAARAFHGSLLFYNLAGAIVRIEAPPENPRERAEAIVNLFLPEENG